MEVFEITGEYILLNKLLKALNWCESGAHANAVIDDGLVCVNGNIELRKRHKLLRGTVIEFNKERIKLA